MKVVLTVVSSNAPACTVTGSPAALVVEPDSDDDGLLRVYNRNTWKNFEMDKVFSPSSTQEQVKNCCFNHILTFPLPDMHCNNYCVCLYVGVQ